MNDTKAWVDVVAGCVIRQKAKYLLVQEKQAKVYDLWNLAAGHVDKGETIEQAAIREAKEESGYDVILEKELLIQHTSVDRPVLHAFQAHIISSALHVDQEEILAAQWFSYNEVKVLQAAGKLRDHWVFDAISLVEAESAL